VLGSELDFYSIMRHRKLHGTGRKAPKHRSQIGKRLVNSLPPQAWMSGMSGSRDRLQIMRKQFVDSVDRVLCHAREHIRSQANGSTALRLHIAMKLSSTAAALPARR